MGTTWGGGSKKPLPKKNRGGEKLLIWFKTDRPIAQFKRGKDSPKEKK